MCNMVNKFGGRTLPPNSPKWKIVIPPNLKNQKSEILESKINYPQNIIWGIQLKSQGIGTSSKPCKASKIHSSSDIQLEPGKRKVLKADESVEICRKQANSDENENPCEWRGNAICRGFLLWKGIFLDINRYRVNIITVVNEIYNSRNRKEQ